MSEDMRSEAMGAIALAALERRTEEERLRREIAESVRRCANADRRENLELAPAGVAPR